MTGPRLVAKSGEFVGKSTVARRLHHAAAADDGPSLHRCRGSEADAPAIRSMNLPNMLPKASAAGGGEEGGGKEVGEPPEGRADDDKPPRRG